MASAQFQVPSVKVGTFGVPHAQRTHGLGCEFLSILMILNQIRTLQIGFRNADHRWPVCRFESIRLI